MTERWKKKTIYSIRVLFSYVLWNQHSNWIYSTDPRYIYHILQSRSTVNEELLKKNIVSQNISAVKRKVECFFEYFTSITHDVTGWATCPVPVSCCHGDANRYARSLSISVPRSLIMDYRRCLSTEQRTENGFSEVYYVCWLCKSSRPFTWIKKIKNCCEQRLTFQTMQSPSWKKKKMSRREKANVLPIIMPL